MTPPISLSDRLRANQLHAEGYNIDQVATILAKEILGALSDSAALDAIAYLFKSGTYADQQEAIVRTILALNGRDIAEDAS